MLTPLNRLITCDEDFFFFFFLPWPLVHYFVDGFPIGVVWWIIRTQKQRADQQYTCLIDCQPMLVCPPLGRSKQRP